MKIALDAMGGDHAPASEVEGAALAVREYGVEIVMVGDDALVREEMRRQGVQGLAGLTVHHASQRVEMHEQPSQVARRKRDSSIWVGTELVKNGEAVGIVSAGNTGATVVTAFFLLGVIKGVERPAIATLIPTLTGHTIVLDVGATVDCTPHHLTQFALMGNEYAQHVLHKAHPAIGLLSIGEEDTKGNEVTKETFKRLKESPLNFVGNVEGRDIFTGAADVVVCDGFMGNVALKIIEGVSTALKKMLIKEIAVESMLSRFGYALLKRRLPDSSGAWIMRRSAARRCWASTAFALFRMAVRPGERSRTPFAWPRKSTMGGSTSISSAISRRAWLFFVSRPRRSSREIAYCGNRIGGAEACAPQCRA